MSAPSFCRRHGYICSALAQWTCCWGGEDRTLLLLHTHTLNRATRSVPDRYRVVCVRLGVAIAVRTVDIVLDVWEENVCKPTVLRLQWAVRDVCGWRMQLNSLCCVCGEWYACCVRIGDAFDTWVQDQWCVLYDDVYVENQLLEPVRRHAADIQGSLGVCCWSDHRETVCMRCFAERNLWSWFRLWKGPLNKALIWIKLENASFPGNFQRSTFLLVTDYAKRDIVRLDYYQNQ